jgi:hypothetical protein
MRPGAVQISTDNYTWLRVLADDSDSQSAGRASVAPDVLHVGEGGRADLGADSESCTTGRGWSRGKYRKSLTGRSNLSTFVLLGRVDKCRFICKKKMRFTIKVFEQGWFRKMGSV